MAPPRITNLFRPFPTVEASTTFCRAGSCISTFAVGNDGLNASFSDSDPRLFTLFPSPTTVENNPAVRLAQWGVPSLDFNPYIDCRLMDASVAGIVLSPAIEFAVPGWGGSILLHSSIALGTRGGSCEINEQGIRNYVDARNQGIQSRGFHPWTGPVLRENIVDTYQTLRNLRHNPLPRSLQGMDSFLLSAALSERPNLTREESAHISAEWVSLVHRCRNAIENVSDPLQKIQIILNILRENSTLGFRTYFYQASEWIGYLLGNKQGNCVARGRMLLALLSACEIELPEGYNYSVQLFKDHVQVLVLDERNSPELKAWDLMNSVATGQEIDFRTDFRDAPLFHPLIEMHAYLKRMGFRPPLRVTQLMLYRSSGSETAAPVISPTQQAFGNPDQEIVGDGYPSVREKFSSEPLPTYPLEDEGDYGESEETEIPDTPALLARYVNPLNPDPHLEESLNRLHLDFMGAYEAPSFRRRSQLLHYEALPTRHEKEAYLLFLFNQGMAYHFSRPSMRELMSSLDSLESLCESRRPELLVSAFLQIQVIQECVSALQLAYSHLRNIRGEQSSLIFEEITRRSPALTEFKGGMLTLIAQMTANPDAFLRLVNRVNHVQRRAALLILGRKAHNEPIWIRLQNRIQDLPIMNTPPTMYQDFNAPPLPRTQNVAQSFSPVGAIEVDLYIPDVHTTTPLSLTTDALTDLVLHMNIRDYDAHGFFDTMFSLGNPLSNRWTPELSQHFLQRSPDDWDYLVLIGTGYGFFSRRTMLHPEPRFSRSYGYLDSIPDLRDIFANIPRHLIEGPSPFPIPENHRQGWRDLVRQSRTRRNP